MATLDYVPGSVEPPDFTDLPAGDYPAIISNSEVKTTKDGLGRYLNLAITIIEGNGKGRIFFDRLNLWNSNQTATLIAHQTLEVICRALAIKHQLRDSAELHHKPLIIRLGYDERDRQGFTIQEGRRNSVKAYKPYASAQQYQPPVAPVWNQPVAPAPVQQYQPPVAPAPVQQHQPPVAPAPVQQYQPPAHTFGELFGNQPVAPTPAQPPAAPQGNINQPPPWER